MEGIWKGFEPNKKKVFLECANYFSNRIKNDFQPAPNEINDTLGPIMKDLIHRYFVNETKIVVLILEKFTQFNNSLYYLKTE